MNKSDAASQAGTTGAREPAGAEQWLRQFNHLLESPTNARTQAEFDFLAIMLGGCEPESERFARLARVAEAYAAHRLIKQSELMFQPQLRQANDDINELRAALAQVREETEEPE